MRWMWRQRRERDLEREPRSDLELEAAEQQEPDMPLGGPLATQPW